MVYKFIVIEFDIKYYGFFFGAVIFLLNIKVVDKLIGNWRFCCIFFIFDIFSIIRVKLFIYYSIYCFYKFTMYLIVIEYLFD